MEKTTNFVSQALKELEIYYEFRKMEKKEPILKVDARRMRTKDLNRFKKELNDLRNDYNKSKKSITLNSNSKEDAEKFLTNIARIYNFFYKQNTEKREFYQRYERFDLMEHHSNVGIGIFTTLSFAGLLSALGGTYCACEAMIKNLNWNEILSLALTTGVASAICVGFCKFVNGDLFSSVSGAIGNFIGEHSRSTKRLAECNKLMNEFKNQIKEDGLQIRDCELLTGKNIEDIMNEMCNENNENEEVSQEA